MHYFEMKKSIAPFPDLPRWGGGSFICHGMQKKVHSILGGWRWYRHENVVFINLVNVSLSNQSVAARIGITATVGMYHRPEVILYEL